MNKRILYLAVLSALLISCQREFDFFDSAPKIKAETETPPDTRTTLSTDYWGTGRIYWTPGDQINVFYGTKSTHYVSQNTENATSAVFKTTDSVIGSDVSSNNIWGLYPYDSSATCDGNSVTTSLPASQAAVPESFDEDLFITLAHSTSTSLRFFNVCSGIKFSLARVDIKSITFKGNDNEDLAGQINLSFENDLPVATVVEGVKEITLTPKDGEVFKQGVNYYIITLPTTLSKGFTISFTRTDGSVGTLDYSDSPIELKRSIFSRKLQLDAYAVFGDDPQPNNVIYYTSSDGAVVNPNNPDAFGSGIVSNEYVDGKGVITFERPVLNIGSNAFQNCTSLTSVDLPNSVTNIGYSAFAYCYNLTAIEIPESTTSLGSYAFQSCAALTSVIIPKSVTSVGNSVFRYCSDLTSIVVVPDNSIYDSRDDCNAIIETETNTLIAGCKSTVIPGSVTNIGNYAFQSCSALTSIEIPTTVTSIGSYAFQACSGLKSIEIPSSVTSIDNYAFRSCSALTSITMSSTVPATIGSRVFDSTNNCPIFVPAESVDVYKTTEGWDAYADRIFSIDIKGKNNRLFYTSSDGRIVTPGNSSDFGANIVSNEYVDGRGVIIFDGDVTRIQNSAFWGCSTLTSIEIPCMVTSISNSAFGYCSSLTSMIVDNDNPIFDSRDDCNAIIETKTKTLIVGCQNTIIPNTITSIGDIAFYYCTELTSIVIPKSVTSIVYNVFYGCSNLTSIAVESGNPIFDSRNGCNAVIETETNSLIIGCKGTIIPDSVTSIGDYAFNYCSGLTSIEIPESVTSIGNYAFQSCSGLTSITLLTNNPATIGYGVFDNTNNCPIFVPSESVDTYKSTEGWSEYAERIYPLDMKGNNNVLYYTSSDGMIITPYNPNDFGANIVSNEYIDGRGVITFDGDVIRIGNNAFRNCYELTSIEIPSMVTSIGRYAFQNCTSLTSIEIPKSVRSIESFVFRYCSALVSIVVDINNPFYDSRDDCNAVIDKQSNFLIIGCQKTIIPNSVTGIGSYAFYGYSELTTLEIPNSVISIGSYAISNCNKLTSIAIPNSVTSIGYSAFYCCSGLMSIVVDSGNSTYDSREGCNAIIETKTNSLIIGCPNTVIPSSVSSIGSGAFNNCYNLTSIDIPYSVTNIGENAFQSCYGLTSIEISSSVTSIGNYAFNGCYNLKSINILTNTPATIGIGVFDSTNNCPIYVPSESVDTYKSAEGWIAYADRIFPLETKGKNNKIFYTSSDGKIVSPYNTNAFGASIVSNEYVDGKGIITFDGDVTRIGDNAFWGRSNLSSIEIPYMVTSIGYNVFGYCSSLTNIVVVEGHPTFDSRDGCNAIILSETNTLIAGCLGTIIPDSVTSIRYNAFAYCSELSFIEIPNSVTSIGNSAFEGCSGLTSIAIPASVTSIDTGVFRYCSGLTSMVVDAGNSTYDSRNGCNAIIETASNTLIAGCQNSVILNSIVSIGDNAFQACSELKSLEIPSSVTSIGNYAFESCSGLSSLEIPSSVKNIGYYAFSYCNSLTIITVRPASPPSVTEYTFVNTYCPIYVPSGSINAYKSAAGWSTYKDRIRAIGTENDVPVPEAIDLGLSVRWASFNLGASRPEEFGNYYAWGEIKTKSEYSWDTYKWGYPPSKYNQTDGKTTLDASDDVVRVFLKGNWRMPTVEEEKELYDNCTREYVQVNGIYGYRMTGPNGNSIFLPAAGLFDGDGYRSNENWGGWYWSSTAYSTYYASGFYFGNGYFYTGNNAHDRCDGHVIRPICP